jgi:L-histidine N-alpha-methyltransferase
MEMTMNSPAVEDRLEIINVLHDTFLSNMRNDVREGLTSLQKFIPSKYFYDAYGSDLFRKICALPEYYQTRTELAILKKAASALMENFHEGDLIELGSGANVKIRTILDAAFAFPADICYMPIDVCESTLIDSSRELLNTYPDLRVTGIVADFTRHIRNIPAARRKLITFFGSTIGNFADNERSIFLRNIAGLMEPGDRFLLGIDMIKPKDLLERAYNDQQGTTAEFNKNILRVANRELCADFNLDHFDHHAFYDEAKEQVEMHLVANRNITALIQAVGLSVEMHKHETIHTEMCRKFSRKSAETMAEEAGLKITRWFWDPKAWFSLIEMAPMS